MAQNWTRNITDGLSQAGNHAQSLMSTLSNGFVRAGGAVKSNVLEPMGKAKDMAGGVGQQMGNAINSQARPAMSSLADQTEQIGQSLGGFAGIISQIGGSLLRFMFNPLTLIVALIAAAVARLQEVENRAVNVQRALGAGQQNMSQFQAITQSTVDKWHHLGVRTEQVVGIIQSIGSSMRDMNMVSGQMVSQITQMSLAGGATKDEFTGALSSILQMQQGMFRTKEEAQKASLSALRYARNLAAANGVPINQMMNQLANVSDNVAMTMGSNPKALSQAVIQASSLGTTLEGVASIMNNMMNIEQSIGNEMEASVLLGKNLNLEKLRAASFAGDEVSVMRELKSLVGSQFEFERMLPIQRKSYAQALGMSVSEMQRMMGFETQAEIQGRQRQAANDRMVSVATTMMEKLKQTIRGIGLQFATVMEGPVRSFRTWLTQADASGTTGLDRVSQAAQVLANGLQQAVSWLGGFLAKGVQTGSMSQAFLTLGGWIRDIVNWLGQGDGKLKNWHLALGAVAAVKLGGLISVIGGIGSALLGVNRNAGIATGGISRMLGALGAAYTAGQSLNSLMQGRKGEGIGGLIGSGIGFAIGGPMGSAVLGQLGRGMGKRYNDTIIRPGAAPIEVSPADTLIAVKEGRGGATYISHKGAGLTGEKPPQPISYNFDLGPVTARLDALTSAILKGGKVYLDGRAVGRAQSHAATGAS